MGHLLWEQRFHSFENLKISVHESVKPKLKFDFGMPSKNCLKDGNSLKIAKETTLKNKLGNQFSKIKVFRENYWFHVQTPGSALSYTYGISKCHLK